MALLYFGAQGRTVRCLAHNFTSRSNCPSNHEAFRRPRRRRHDRVRLGLRPRPPGRPIHPAERVPLQEDLQPRPLGARQGLERLRRSLEEDPRHGEAYREVLRPVGLDEGSVREGPRGRFEQEGGELPEERRQGREVPRLHRVLPRPRDRGERELDEDAQPRPPHGQDQVRLVRRGRLGHPHVHREQGPDREEGRSQEGSAEEEGLPLVVKVGGVVVLRRSARTSATRADFAFRRSAIAVAFAMETPLFLF
ncbi:hypothetical protein ACHAWF_001125 [Thalassiosira exigua]